MTLGYVWPRLRPLSRRLAVVGWASSAAGMVAGLAVAIASGTRLSPLMTTFQAVSTACMAVALTSFVTAASLQPRSPEALHLERREIDPGAEFPATVQSFLLGSIALLAGAVAFACAGLVLRSGPSAQSVAFCQVFLLGAAASGFTFMLFSKAAPHRGGN